MKNNSVVSNDRNNYADEVIQFIRKNFAWILAFLFFSVFLILSHSVLKKEVFEFDSVIYNFIHSFNTPFMTEFFRFITHFAGGYILVGICLIFYFFRKDRRLFYLITLNFVNTVVFNQLLKLFFARERPLGTAIIEESGYSFPSGHSMAAMSFYGLLIYIVYHSKINLKIKIALISGLLLLILLIGISRVYLGVHYVSDVIGGFCLSATYLIIFTRITQKYLLRGDNDEK